MPFARPTLTQLRDRAETELRTRLGLGPLLRRSFLKALAWMTAGAAHLLHGHAAWAALQLLPDTSESEWLERHANLWGIQRKPALGATGTVDFTGTNGSDIPAGSKVTRVDGQEFLTRTLVTIAAGTAAALVDAVQAGAASDTDATTELTLSSPLVGVNSIALVDANALTGGADQETDDDLRKRLLARLKDAPGVGTIADYSRWTLEVSGVTRAFPIAQHLGLGTVGVTFARDDDPGGPIPTAGQVATVQAYLDPRAPVTATVTVFIPTEDTLDPDITLTPDTGTVRQAVVDALTDLVAREGGPGEVVELTHIAEAISTAAGETDHILNSPVADVAVGAGAILTIGTPVWS